MQAGTWEDATQVIQLIDKGPAALAIASEVTTKIQVCLAGQREYQI